MRTSCKLYSTMLMLANDAQWQSPSEIRPGWIFQWILKVKSPK